MRFSQFHHWQSVSEREARECANISRATGEVAGSATGFLIRNHPIMMGFDMSRGFIDGLIDSFDADQGSTAEKQRQMKGIQESMRILPPGIKQAIERLYITGPKPTFAQIHQLINTQNWIEYFKNGLNADHPLHALLHFNDDQKEQYQYEFITNIIPLSIQDQYEDLFGEKGLDLTQKKQNIETHKTDILQAIEYILMGNASGVNQNNPSLLLAKATLRNRYKKPDGTLNTTFEKEMADATKNSPTLRTPSEIAGRMGPSMLKGMLDPSLGLFTDADRVQIQAHLSKRSIERNLVTHHGTQEHQKLSGVLKQEGAETIGEMISGMSGFEKIALVGLAWMLLTKKTGQFIAGTGALMYFGQKLVLKQEDPLNEIWVPIVRNITSKATYAMQDPIEKLTGYKFADKKLTPEEVANRFQIVEQFMRDDLKIENQESIHAMALLSNMTLGELVDNSIILPDGRVSIHYTPEMKAKVTPMLEKMGLDGRAITKFFEKGEAVISPEYAAQLGIRSRITNNTIAAGEAVSGLAYRVAVQLFPEKYARKAHLIEQYRTQFGVGYMDLPHTTLFTDVNSDGLRENFDAHAAYIDMVTAGFTALRSPQYTSLARTKAHDFIADHLAISDTQDIEREISREETEFVNLKNEVQAKNNFHGEDAQFTVERNGDRVLVKLVGVVPDTLDAGYDFREFLHMNSADIVLENAVTKMCEGKGVDVPAVRIVDPKLTKPTRNGNSIQFAFDTDTWEPLKPTMNVISFLQTPLRDAPNSINLLVQKFIDAFDALPIDADGKKDISTLKMSLEEYRV